MATKIDSTTLAGAASPARDSQETAVSTRTGRLIGLAAVLLLTAVFAAANWHWLRANVVTYGWDRLDHLITSLVYRDILGSITPKTLLSALAYSDYYPPLVHYGTVVLYRLFGVDEDIAVMVNIFYMAILLGSAWWIGRRLHGVWTGVLAAVLLGLFPMIFAMSRYFYLDFALTALVALCMALLLASERFTRRRPSLGFGLALGAAFLVKWTTAAFVFGPLLYIVLRSGVLVYAWRNPRRLLPNWLRLLVALVIGVGAIGLWFWLAQDVVAGLKLGWLPALPLGLLLGGVVYTLFFAGRDAGGVPGARQLRHVLGAAVIAAFTAGLWYLINFEFINYFLFTAYGREEPFYAFAKYFGEVSNEQLGLWFSFVFLVVALAWLWQQRHRLRRLLPDLGDTGWVLLLWVVVPYFIFSFRVTLAHSRFVMPFLPPFALWMAAGLVRWRPAWLRAAAIVVVLAVGVAQYALISFDELARYRPALVLPIAGSPVNLLANGFFIQYPTSGVTDPGYAVAPQVLGTVEQARQSAGKDTINLGLIVNSYQVHEKHFLYQIYKYFPQVRLRELARNWNGRPAYNQLFEMDYVLVSDTHTFRTGKESQEAARRILFDPQDAFNQAFKPVQHYTLPSGEQLTLYARRYADIEPSAASEDYGKLLELFGNRLGPGDALVLTSPDQVYMTGLALPSAAGAAVAPLPADPGADTGADPGADLAARLAQLAQGSDRIFLVAHNAEKVDPSGSIEGWLRDHLAAGSDQWANSIRLTPFVPIDAGQTQPLQAAAWPGGPTLQSAVQVATRQGLAPQPGGAVVVRLTWADVASATGTTGAAGATDAVRKASLQLLGADGSLVAQEDRDLAAGDQQFVLLIPRSTPPGVLKLALAVYDPATLKRLPTQTGAEMAELGRVQVAPAQPAAPKPLPELRHPSDLETEGQ